MRTKVTILLGIFMSTLVLVGCMYDEPSIQTGDYPFVKEGKRWNCRNGENDFVYKMMGGYFHKIKGVQETICAT